MDEPVENVIVSLLSKMPDKRIAGKKAFQKLTYFLQEVGTPLQLHFGLHFYGPYSFELANYMQAMEMEGLLFTREIGNSVEVALGLSGKELADQTTSIDGVFTEAIDFVTTRLGDKSPADLELLATTHFIAKQKLRNRKKVCVSDIVGAVYLNKQGKFTKKDIRQAASELVGLGFFQGENGGRS